MRGKFSGLAAGVILPLALTAIGVTDAARPNGVVSLIRTALGAYKDVNYAIAMGYEPGACVSGPNGGGMGVHFVKGELLDDAPPQLDQPEALIYEPLPNGGYRLAGVEYITFAAPPAILEGHLLNYAGTPNRYGIPAPYLELHVWAWAENPNGTFADWNPNVSCDAFVP